MNVIIADDQKLTTKLTLKLSVNVEEYPQDGLRDKKFVEHLNQILSKELTKEALNVIQKMQKVDHDGFGVGRHVMAFYPETWKRLDWSEAYKQQVKFEPKIEVAVVGHGILN